MKWKSSEVIAVVIALLSIFGGTFFTSMWTAFWIGVIVFLVTYHVLDKKRKLS